MSKGGFENQRVMLLSHNIPAGFFPRFCNCVLSEMNFFCKNNRAGFLSCVLAGYLPDHPFP